MDKSTRLILAHAAPPASWEDEEKATNDLGVLREEFRKRLYSERGARLLSPESNRERDDNDK
jgi:hypothetical protein